MPLRVTILGSGTIIPSNKRKAAGLLIETPEVSYLFDCGPGTLDTLERIGRSFGCIRIIFLTHYHADHTLDIGRLLSVLNNEHFSGPRGDITIAGPHGLSDFIDGWNRLYRSTISKRAHIDTMEIGSGRVRCDGAAGVAAVEVDHGNGSALAYRVDNGGASVVYTGDTSYTESLVDFAGGADLLIAECSFPDDHPVEGHMTPSDVARLASRSSVARVVLTHLYPVFGDSDPAGAASKGIAVPVSSAEDGMVIELQ